MGPLSGKAKLSPANRDLPNYHSLFFSPQWICSQREVAESRQAAVLLLPAELAESLDERVTEGQRGSFLRNFSIAQAAPERAACFAAENRFGPSHKEVKG